MRASLALPCSSLPDRRHATPQFFHPSIDAIPKKNARHFLHPPLSAPSAVHNRGLRHVGSAHVPHRRALSYMVYACSTRLSQLSSAAPPAHLWCFLSISLPPQEARGLCLREALLQARNDAGVAKGLLAAWESKASLLIDESDWGLRRHA